MKTVSALAVILVTFLVLWVTGQIRISPIDPIDLAKENMLYSTDRCDEAKEHKRLFCSRASCQNALIARGYATADTQFVVLSTEYDLKDAPDRFVHFVQFESDEKEWKLKCVMDYLRAVSISWSETGQAP